MRKRVCLILLIALALCARSGWCGSSVLEYPTTVLDMHDADGSCWTGIDAFGYYPARVLPERWLVGPPPSAESAVTLPADHWLDLGFSGELVDGQGDDVVLVETGKAGEQALLFVTDGGQQEYLLTKVVIESSMTQELSHVGGDLAGVTLPFVPRAIRLVALDMGGQSPGFDLVGAQARVSHECGLQAGCPNPISGVQGIDPNVPLSWTPGATTERHVVYFSGAAPQVEAGAIAVRSGPRSGDVNTFDPSSLQLGRTYFWRVDGLGSTDADPVYEGDVWSFTVADHVAVDDFEVYADLPALWEAWRPHEYAELALEQEVSDTCQQSLVFSYYCDRASEASMSRSFATDQDWTRGDARVLQVLLHGDLPDLESGEFYIVLTDGANSQVVCRPAITEIEDLSPWCVCRIALGDLTGIDLTRIRGVILGVRSPSSAQAGTSSQGTLWISEIGLYGAVCPEGNRPRADLTQDCKVDYADLERIAADWLCEPACVYETAMPKKPVVWYEFDGNARDRMGRADGRIHGHCSFVDGVYGQAIQFASQGDVVTIPDAAGVFEAIHSGITIAFWQKGDDSGHLNDTLFCSNYTYDQSNPAIAIHLGCWRDPGQYRWDCGSPWSFDNRLAGAHQDKSDWTGRWNHWAFTKQAGVDGYMEIYLNGALYDRASGTETPITGITGFEIGSGWYGHYDGLIDDVQIFDYALSAAEVAYVATDGVGLFERPACAADLNADEKVDLHDYAVLAAEWLRDEIWP